MKNELFPAAAFAVGAVAAAVVGEFAVETFCELLVSSFADGDDGAGEVERLAGEFVVEVHLDLLGADFQHATGNHAAVVGHHRDGGSLGDARIHLAVGLEHRAGQVDHGAGGIDAVALLGGEDEVEGFADFLAEDSGFKLGQEIAHTKNKLKGFVGIGAVALGTFDLQYIREGDYFVVGDFHIIQFGES